MGAIQDVFAILTELGRRKEFKQAQELLDPLRSLLSQIQSEHAALHEANIELRERSFAQTSRIQELEAKLLELESEPAEQPDDIPTCPNCSTKRKPFYMSRVTSLMNTYVQATYQCSQCKFLS